MVGLTDIAVLKFKEVIEKQGRDGEGIRLYAVPGGWSPSLAMDIAKDPVEGDTTIEKDGFKLFLERKAHDILYNTTIDFMEGHGFVITGAQNSCGSCSC